MLHLIQKPSVDCGMSYGRQPEAFARTINSWSISEG